MSKDTPVAVTMNPVDFIRVSKFVSNPRDFFFERFALRNLYMLLNPSKTKEQSNDLYPVLIEKFEDNISLSMKSKNKIRITYQGKERQTGVKLVGFYSKLLLKKSEDGIKRSSRKAQKTEQSFGPVSLAGSMEITEQQALFRSERILPALKIFLIFVVLVLILFGVLGWADQSFKSERQTARYLGLSALGSLPDLRKISKTMDVKTSI